MGKCIMTKKEEREWYKYMFDEDCGEEDTSGESIFGGDN